MKYKDILSEQIERWRARSQETQGRQKDYATGALGGWAEASIRFQKCGSLFGVTIEADGKRRSGIIYSDTLEHAKETIANEVRKAGLAPKDVKLRLQPIDLRDDKEFCIQWF